MSAIQDKLKKIPPKHKALLLLVLPIAMIAAFVYLVYIPKQGKIKILKQTIADNKAEIDKGRIMERKLTELKVANAKLQDQLKVVQERLPSDKEGIEVLKGVVEQSVKDAGLELKAWTPGAKMTGAGGFFIQVPISVEIEGNFHEVGKFMEGVDGLKRLLGISNFTMSSAKLQGREMVIPVRFTLLAYYSVGGK